MNGNFFIHLIKTDGTLQTNTVISCRDSSTPLSRHSIFPEPTTPVSDFGVCVCVCSRVISVTLNSLSCARLQGQRTKQKFMHVRQVKACKLCTVMLSITLYMHHSLDRNVFKRPEFNIHLHHLHTHKNSSFAADFNSTSSVHTHTQQLSPHPFSNERATS